MLGSSYLKKTVHIFVYFFDSLKKIIFKRKNFEKFFYKS